MAWTLESVCLSVGTLYGDAALRMKARCLPTPELHAVCRKPISAPRPPGNTFAAMRPTRRSNGPANFDGGSAGAGWIHTGTHIAAVRGGAILLCNGRRRMTSDTNQRWRGLVCTRGCQGTKQVAACKSIRYQPVVHWPDGQSFDGLVRHAHTAGMARGGNLPMKTSDLRQHRERRQHRCPGGSATTLILTTIAGAMLGGCASRAITPMSQSKELMDAAWGPFARQCTSMRTSHFADAGRSGVKEVGTEDESCIGFVATPASGGAIEITGSMTSEPGPSTPIVLRILRAPGGVSRPAAPGDTGLLAQGSDSPQLAQAFAEQIGLTQKQVIDPNATLRLPIFLAVPSPLQGTLQCRPDGGSVDRGRETLIFSCTLDERVHTDRLDARVQLAGVEEVDVLSGVRLSGSFAGSVSGRERISPAGSGHEAIGAAGSGRERISPAGSGHDGISAAGSGRRVDYHIWYERTTELE
jgi:hypothetical protein